MSRRLTLKPAEAGAEELRLVGFPELVRLDSLSGRPHRWPTETIVPGMDTAALRTRHAVATDAGRQRGHNEDAFAVDPALGLFVVCDGVGGRASGEVASTLAALTIQKWVQREATTLAAVASSPRDAAAVASAGVLVRDAVQSASLAIRDLARSDQQLEGMRTTASVALVVRDFAVVGQVGDSRVYLGRGAGVHQLTEDHTLHNLLVQQGLMRPDPERGCKSPLVRALGCNNAVEVDILALPLLAGDRLLLCSDGLHGYFEDDDDLRELFRLDVCAAAPAAIQHANRRGGKDNITALFVELVP